MQQLSGSDVVKFFEAGIVSKDEARALSGVGPKLGSVSAERFRGVEAERDEYAADLQTIVRDAMPAQFCDRDDPVGSARAFFDEYLRVLDRLGDAESRCRILETDLSTLQARVDTAKGDTALKEGDRVLVTRPHESSTGVKWKGGEIVTVHDAAPDCDGEITVEGGPSLYVDPTFVEPVDSALKVGDRVKIVDGADHGYRVGEYGVIVERDGSYWLVRADGYNFDQSLDADQVRKVRVFNVGDPEPEDRDTITLTGIGKPGTRRAGKTTVLRYGDYGSLGFVSSWWNLPHEGGFTDRGYPTHASWAWQLENFGPLTEV